MSGSSQIGSRVHIEQVILQICHLIKQRRHAELCQRSLERELRIELFGCLLSSQVRSSTASAVLRHLIATGLLDDELWYSSNISYEDLVRGCLKGSRKPGLQIPSYRFPNSKAKQLAHVRTILRQKGLQARLLKSYSPTQMRARLVAEIPGLGPKQASMFLRNVGFSDDLAVIDSHIIRFLKLNNALDIRRNQLGHLDKYEAVETYFRSFARQLGYAMGLVDMAVWITMKAQSELAL